MPVLLHLINSKTKFDTCVSSQSKQASAKLTKQSCACDVNLRLTWQVMQSKQANAKLAKQSYAQLHSCQASLDKQVHVKLMQNYVLQAWHALALQTSNACALQAEKVMHNVIMRHKRAYLY